MASAWIVISSALSKMSQALTEIPYSMMSPTLLDTRFKLCLTNYNKSLFNSVTNLWHVSLWLALSVPKGAFTNYVCIFWHFLTRYVHTSHFLCSKLTVNLLDQLALTRLSAVADRSAPLCGTPFIWRTPRGASSVPTSDSRYECSECECQAKVRWRFRKILWPSQNYEL